MAERKRVEDPAFQNGPIEELLPAGKEKAEAKEAEQEAGDDLGTLDEVEDAEQAAPTYKREDIGPRLTDHAMNVGTEKETAEDLKEKLDHDDMVPLLFPKKVMLQDGGLMHTWEAGVHLVPAALAKHWYLRHCKVKKAGAVIKAQKAD